VYIINILTHINHKDIHIKNYIFKLVLM